MLGKSVRETIATQSASNPYQVNSLALGADTNPIAGVVKWDPVRSAWNGTNLVAAIALAPIYATWDAIAVFLVVSALTLCTGHSVGYHRRLVHRSFKCSKWLERLLVWMGAAVGMGGPLWTISHPRHARLGAAPAAMPRLPGASPRTTEGRMVEFALPPCARQPAGFRSRPWNRRRSFLQIPGTYLDVASTAYWLGFFRHR